MTKIERLEREFARLERNSERLHRKYARQKNDKNADACLAAMLELAPVMLELITIQGPWDIKPVIESAQPNPLLDDYRELIDNVEEILRELAGEPLGPARGERDSLRGNLRAEIIGPVRDRLH
jgi:hypothetical protein